jgi:hypothetical protein
MSPYLKIWSDGNDSVSLGVTNKNNTLKVIEKLYLGNIKINIKMNNQTVTNVLGRRKYWHSQSLQDITKLGDLRRRLENLYNKGQTNVTIDKIEVKSVSNSQLHDLHNWDIIRNNLIINNQQYLIDSISEVTLILI